MNKKIKKLSQMLVGLRTRHFLTIDAICFAIAPLLALEIRLDGIWNLTPYLSSLAVITVLFVTVKLGIFYAGGFYRRYWEYAGQEEMLQITMLMSLCLGVEVILFQEIYQLDNSPILNLPRSLPLLDAMISFLLVAGIRFTIPALARWNQKPWKVERRDRVLVVGAGCAGTSLVQTMQRSPEVGLDPIAFIDDDDQKISKQIRKLTVVGNRFNIPEVVKSLNISKVMIAIPSAPGREIREIVEICQSIGVPTSTLPGLNEIINGRVSLGSLREVQIEDLLRRAPIETDTQKVVGLIGGKKVLITGGGGSIGSELSRQILKCAPAEIIIVGHGENSVFNIEQELTKVLSEIKKTSKNHQINITKLTAFIADIRKRERLEYVFETARPDMVFHAAAHKHVPMMELNPAEAITNNVRGTKNLLDMALKYNVQNFVMISTDKAVNPTSIMGASKRVAEMLVLQAAEKSKKPFVVVRFGNVLGSRGSVVPTFKRQIAEGGPITITHPDIIRYFMTIPEAVQLVLQAAVIGNGGEVFMLEMGEPVRIFDLAKDLIRLSGYEVGKDIEIAFTGLRPGEKLFEELFIPGEKYNKTKHKKIRSLGNASRLVKENIDEEVEALCQAGDRNDTTAIISMLQQLVPEYVPGYLTANLHDNTAKETTASAKITSVSLQLEKDLRVALANEEFRIHYQPIVCLETNQISSFEALLRWHHPARGLLWPDEFLPAAEETGLIVPIGECMLRRICSQMKIWESQFHLQSPLVVSVNLTSKQLFHADLIETIAQILKETNLDVSSLRLEIPEEVVTYNSELAGSVFVQLKTLGIQVQIDHCGLSDVSLNQLYQLTRLKYGKFDSLKLDCSLVSGLDASKPNLEILQKIIEITQELDMGMIATGVETSWQIDRLKSMKCLYGQGYFFSKPVECAAVGKLIGAGNIS